MIVTGRKNTGVRPITRGQQDVPWVYWERGSMRSTMGGSVYRNVLESNIGKNGIGPVMRLKFLALPLTDPEASPCIVIENYRFIRFDFQFSIFNFLDYYYFFSDFPF